MVVVAAAVIIGMRFRKIDPKVEDISPENFKKGQAKLVDVMGAPIVRHDSYIEPESFNCQQLRDKFLRTPLNKVKDIDPTKVMAANCHKELENEPQSFIVKKLITCLQEKKRSDECAKHLLYFRAYSIKNLLKTQPELLESNDNVKLHKVIWDLATTSEYKENEMEALIKRIDELLVGQPYLYALHKAKLIYIVIKDVLYPKKRIDDRMYKTWETLTELRADTRDNWELRLMNVLKHKVFFEPEDMKNWVAGFLMDFPDYYMSYYYYSYFYWEIMEDKAEAVSWLKAGIEKTSDPTGKLKQQLSEVLNAAVGSKVFNFEFYFQIIHD